MCPAHPPGWEALQERARRATTSSELSEIIAEMNALLDAEEASSSSDLRPTARSHHTSHHTCVFYDSEDKLLDFLVPYYAEGLREGEYCFGAQKAEVRDRLLSRLQLTGIDVQERMSRGALDIRTDKEVYFSDNRFDPLAMMDTLRQAVDNAKAKRFSRIRTAGDLSWAPAYRTLWHQALDYEKLVDEYIPGKPITSVCQYNRGVCTAPVFSALVKVHRSHIQLPDSGR